jgi:TPR repeat protein
MKILRPHALRGDPLAQLTIGNLYHRGLGIGKNIAKAAKWYKRAAHQGDSDAQFMLGLMYLRGDDVDLNRREATTWLRRAASQGHLPAQCASYHLLREPRSA